MKRIGLSFAIILVGALRVWAEPKISAQITGENYGRVETNIVVTAQEQTIFHFHSDSEGGGTWYDVTISIKGGSVTIVERDSTGTPYKSGSKVKTAERIYRLPVDKIVEEELNLSHGNRIVLTSEKESRPATEETGSSEGQRRTVITLDNLVYVDMSPADYTTQHPLVCGAGGDFPNGKEMAFKRSGSQESIHVIFPDSVRPPEKLKGTFALQGYYQGIQNKDRYPFKRPPEDYQYFVVISWEQKEE